MLMLVVVWSHPSTRISCEQREGCLLGSGCCVGILRVLVAYLLAFGCCNICRISQAADVYRLGLVLERGDEEANLLANYLVGLDDTPAQEKALMDEQLLKEVDRKAALEEGKA